jgi:glycerate 2-kinase
VALKILMVPDKFKGTLTAFEAANALGQGWKSVRPEDDIELLPMSDGGDGFGEVLSNLLGAECLTTRTVDAAHRPIDGPWWWSDREKTAIIESARIIGLAMLPRGKYHPFELDTLGLAAVLRDAASRGARRCVIGIGGSATNDGGFGVARGLGWQFSNDHDETIMRWTQLNHLAAIRPPEDGPFFDELIVAVDVQNPFLGPQGCSRVYGPQKGLIEFEFAERCLGQLVQVLEKQYHFSNAFVPGTGAAGGLGFGLISFLNGRIQSGFDIFAEASRLESRIRQSQVVITGEGALDGQTIMGKGVGEVAGLCRRLGIPCLGLAGVVPDPEEARKLFTQTHGMAPEVTTEASALAKPAFWLERLAAKVAAEWRGERGSDDLQCISTAQVPMPPR